MSTPREFDMGGCPSQIQAWALAHPLDQRSDDECDSDNRPPARIIVATVPQIRGIDLSTTVK
jgi:hypothetical protein